MAHAAETSAEPVRYKLYGIIYHHGPRRVRERRAAGTTVAPKTVPMFHYFGLLRFFLILTPKLCSGKNVGDST
jgi:hypothetical protein